MKKGTKSREGGRPPAGNLRASGQEKLARSSVRTTGIIREKDLVIRRLQKERDEISFSRKKITKQWMDVLEDDRKE